MQQTLHQSISKLKVFLCHSSEDKPRVRDLYNRLASDGFKPWLDEEDISPGQAWDETILRSVRESDVVVVCLSGTSVNKVGYIQKEIRFALDVADLQPEGKIFIIPARLEECKVPDRLSYWQWVDLYKDDGYRKLLRSLKDCEKNSLDRANSKTSSVPIGKSSNVRPPTCAGVWYAADPKKLIKSIDSAFSKVTIDIPEQKIVGLFAPNAGAIYCWDVAAQSIGQIRGLNIDTVAMVTEAQYPYDVPLLTSAHESFYTPLGEVPIDRLTINDLSNEVHSSLGFGLTPVANDKEHSTEMILPMLQRALLGKFTILPIMMKGYSHDNIKGLSKALMKVLTGKRAILVVSACLSHFYPVTTAQEIDKKILSAIESFVPQKVIDTEEQGHNVNNGIGPLATVMYTSKALGANKSTIVGYSHSGNVTGDESSVVGYGAAVFSR